MNNTGNGSGLGPLNGMNNLNKLANLQNQLSYNNQPEDWEQVLKLAMMRNSANKQLEERNNLLNMMGGKPHSLLGKNNFIPFFIAVTVNFSLQISTAVKISMVLWTQVHCFQCNENSNSNTTVLARTIIYLEQICLDLICQNSLISTRISSSNNSKHNKLVSF